MLKILSFDFAALTLLIILLGSVILRRMTKGVSNKCYLLTLLTLIITTVFDIWAIHMDNIDADAGIMYIAHLGYLIFRNVTTPVYLAYVISLTDSWHTNSGQALCSSLHFSCL